MAKGKDARYEVQVWTSDVHGAGTDADVFIQISGTDGQTEKIELHDDSNNFERGKRDNFSLTAPDVGYIKKINIGHNAENLMSGWHLHKVCIKKHTDTKTQPSTNQPRTEKPSEYWFLVNRWFDTSEDDKKIEREIVATDEQGHPIKTPIDNKQESRMSESEAAQIEAPTPQDEIDKPNEQTDEQTNEQTYVSTERTNNRYDPFYVPSVYDKDPKTELETVNKHKHKPAARAPIRRKVPSRRSGLGSSAAVPVHSPIMEEKTKSLIDVHTEDQEYFTNDFNEIAERSSPSGISEYLVDLDSEKAVGSIRRTLQLLY